MNINKTIKSAKLKGAENPNGCVNVYLNKVEYKEFQRVCLENNISASAVLAGMIREFLESAKK